MGRIDEALRRAGASASGATVGNRDPDDPFTSPWALDEAALPKVGAPPRVAATPATIHRAVEGNPNGSLVTHGVEATAHEGYRQRLATMAATEPALVEQFRRLAATLIQTRRTAPVKVVMVTSAAPEEGKTLTALNLALVLSESFQRRVLLIDADLRRPRITELAQSTIEGLAELVKAPQQRKAPLTPVTDTLTLLPAGRPDPNPLSGVTSERMQELLREAGATFDWVIVDTPPIVAAADASLLCAMADATVLVVRAGQTPFESVQQAIEGIGRERIIGVVLNGVERDAVQSYGDYYVPRDLHSQR